MFACVSLAREVAAVMENLASLGSRVFLVGTPEASTSLLRMEARSRSFIIECPVKVALAPLVESVAPEDLAEPLAPILQHLGKRLALMPRRDLKERWAYGAQMESQGYLEK